MKFKFILFSPWLLKSPVFTVAIPLGSLISNQYLFGRTPRKPQSKSLPIVSIVVPFLVNQNLYYRILTIKLVNQEKELQWRL